MRALESIHPGWGIAAVRVVAGIILVVAGYQKWAGGIDQFSGFMGQVGIPLPGVMGPFIATLELVGGLLLLLGLFTRWLGLLYVAEFIVAAFIVKLPRAGWDNSRIDLMMLAAAVLFLLAGPGKAALDDMLARRRGVPVRA